MIDAIHNATLLDRSGRWTLRLEAGRIAQVTESAGVSPATQPAAAAPSANAIDAAGGLVVPALVDPHLHLDLAYALELPPEILPENRSGTLLEAIGHWSRAKEKLTPENVRDRAVRAIHDEVRCGTGYIRSHVDMGSTAGMRLCEGVLAAREATRDLCTIQLVAFPQDGMLRDAPAVDLVRQAMRAGVDLVGGIPHIERVPRDGLRHLELVFDLAAELDADIDVHIDETDDPSSRYTEHLAALTVQRGWQGRVTASHVCALSSYDDVHAARVIDLLAEARVHVVTNPGVNLHLQGRFDRYPKRRGLTRVRELLDRGIDCAAGQDCIRDPFYPLGNGRMLDQAFLLVHADHLSLPHQIRQAFDMVSAMAGRVTGLRTAGVEPGAPADLAVFPFGTVEELVRLRPDPVAVLHGGRPVNGESAE